MGGKNETFWAKIRNGNSSRHPGTTVSQRRNHLVSYKCLCHVYIHKYCLFSLSALEVLNMILDSDHEFICESKSSGDKYELPKMWCTLLYGPWFWGVLHSSAILNKQNRICILFCSFRVYQKQCFLHIINKIMNVLVRQTKRGCNSKNWKYSICLVVTINLMQLCMYVVRDNLLITNNTKARIIQCQSGMQDEQGWQPWGEDSLHCTP